jgi:hypothetical protein
VAEKAYSNFNERTIFGGPSLYFHQRALEAAKEGAEPFVHAAYAMLVSWGMHRMGKGGAKMGNFEDFRDSVVSHWPSIEALSGLTRDQLTDAHWNQLKSVFLGIRAMATRSILVANSKVLAHALPESVVPIDRNYTLRYVFGSTSINNDPEWQWAKFRAIHQQFFYPLVASPGMISHAKRWLAERNTKPWNTSILKLADNLVIGASQPNRQSS